LKICLHELSIVDDTLEVLGAPKEYQINRIIRIINGFITFFFINFVEHYTILSYNILKNFEISFIRAFRLFALNYLECTIISNVLICGTILGYTNSRFHQVNNRLRVLYSNLFKNNSDCRYNRQNRSILARQQITGAKDHKQYIWIIM
ncbi:hypothetical protein ALC62_08057, partial [Cyphomyrmex costatus]